jgi:peptidoglycan-N-acetylglucosamine deacetylase
VRRSLILSTLAAALLGVLAATALARDTAPADPGILMLTSGRALRSGDRGQPVSALQRLLRDAGFDPGKVDGVFGPLTEDAVRHAQRSLNLKADGLAGLETAAALQQALSGSPVKAALASAQSALSYAVQSGPSEPSATLVVHQAVAPIAPVAPAAGIGPESDQQAKAPPAGATQRFALTFNGAPDLKLLPALLATLKRYGMQATFFLYGETAEQAPDMVAQIAAAGHEVAVNGYSASDMTGLSQAAAGTQLRRARVAVATAAGHAPAYFRPPSGHYDAALAAAAGAAQLKLVLWTNVTVQDPADAEPTDLAERLAGVVYPGAVVMLHQDRAATVAALEPLLAELQAKGYTSTPLSQFDTQ